MKYFEKDTLLKKLDNFLEYLNEQELSENTLKRYKINIISFINFADGKEIKKDTVKEFKNKLKIEDAYLVNTSNNYIVATNKFLRYLNLDNLCVKAFKIQRKDSAEDFINYSDYHRLLRAASLKKDIETYLILRVLAETGIRISELKYFTVENLDTTIIVDNKQKTRSITISRDLLKILRKFARKRKIYKGCVFKGRNGCLHDSTVRYRLKKYAGLSKVKLKKVHPHSFRHYFAKQFLDAYPEDILTLSEMLGHASLETTRIYTKPSNSDKERRIRHIKF